jgi:transcriptional regulator with GAF, ATPase, and Fis domain
MVDEKDNEGEGRPDGAGQEVAQIVKRGAEFTEELLKENERLRYRVADLEAIQSGDGDDRLMRELMDRLRRLENEREKLAERYAQVEAENKSFANRYLEIENENNNLLNIYVASYQLHSTLDFQEVLQIIIEIILNFVGAEVFAIGLVPEDGGGLRPLIAEGVDHDTLAQLPTNRGIIGDVVHSGEPLFHDEFGSREVVPAEPGICVPLKIKGQVIGVVLIYRFLQQKTQLAPVDHELFTLLAGHAATAIFASKLYTDSKRKLKTIQGFIDLMTVEEASG